MRKFSSEAEKKAWGAMMKEARAKKRAERQAKEQLIQKAMEKKIEVGEEEKNPQVQEQKPELPNIPGKVWIKHKSGDILSVEHWLAEDLIKQGEAQYL